MSEQLAKKWLERDDWRALKRCLNEQRGALNSNVEVDVWPKDHAGNFRVLLGYDLGPFRVSAYLRNTGQNNIQADWLEWATLAAWIADLSDTTLINVQLAVRGLTEGYRLILDQYQCRIDRRLVGTLAYEQVSRIELQPG